MTQTKTNTIHSRVKLDGAWEINYWSVTLRCSVPDLTKAIGKVGSCSEAVTNYLKSEPIVRGKISTSVW